MFRIDGPNTVSVKPAYGAAGTQGWFKNYGVGGTLDGPGTIVTPDFLNMLQAELLAVITAGGLTPDKANDAQLLAALDARYVGVSVGDFIITGRDTPRANELRPNGAAISRATYSVLFTEYGERFGAGDGMTTFNLPNLEGEFIRIFDNGRGVDLGRVLGSFQAEAYLAHSHLNGIADNGTSNWVYGASTTDMPGAASVTIAPEALGCTYQGITSTSGGSETRPRNVALNAFIRFI